MNKVQKLILLITITIIFATFVYPPLYVTSYNGVTVNIGYGWVFDPPKGGLILGTVNTSMLLVQWVGVLIVGSLAFFLAKDISEESRRKQPTSGVGGWLLLLVLGMMILGPLFSAAHISGGIMEAERQDPELISIVEWETFKSATWWVFFAFVSISFYGGWGLVYGKDWSVVERAKLILWLTGPVSSIALGLFVPLMVFGQAWMNVSNSLIPGLISSFISASIWVMYLSKSKRVQATYK